MCVCVCALPAEWVHSDWVSSQDKQSSNLTEEMTTHHPFLLLSHSSPNYSSFLRGSIHLSLLLASLPLPSLLFIPPATHCWFSLWIELDLICFGQCSSIQLNFNRLVLSERGSGSGGWRNTNSLISGLISGSSCPHVEVFFREIRHTSMQLHCKMQVSERRTVNHFVRSGRKEP